MDLVRRLLAFLLVLVAMFCVSVWAAWFNEALDLMGWSRYAKEFPVGPFEGPLIATFGCLMVAYVIWPGSERRD